jgi:hypothetical protein
MKALSFVILAFVIITSCKKDKINPSDGVAFFLVKDSVIAASPNISTLSLGVPLIRYNDIVSYDSTTHILELTFPADSIFNKKNKIDGKAFILTVDNVRTYFGYIWSNKHSTIYQMKTFICLTNAEQDPNLFHVYLSKGYPDKLRTVNDMRNDSKIIDRFKQDNKLKH